MPATHLFHETDPRWTVPSERAAEVTPADDAELPFVAKRLYVAEEGTLRLVTAKGDDVTLSVDAGAQVPVKARQIMASNTSASGIVALA